MKINFEIEENYAVQLDSRHIDLHNNFELVEIRKLENRIEMLFNKGKGDWIGKNELNQVRFIFTGVSYTYEEEGDSAAVEHDWKTLSALSFFPSDMRDENHGIMLHSLPNEGDDILFLFEDERVFRVHCEEVELRVE